MIWLFVEGTEPAPVLRAQRARAVPPSLREVARVQRVTEGVASEQSAAYRKSVDRTSKASTAAVHAVLPQALRASSLPEGAKGLRRS